MKHLLFSLIFISFSIIVFSQEIPKINLGVGIPFFNPNSVKSYSGGEHSIGRDRIYLFIEKSALLTFKRNPNLSITPGLAFIQFNEKIGSGALGGSSYRNINRNAVSIYSKFLFNPEFTKNKSWYFGMITGCYLFTKTKGNHDWSFYQEGNYIHGSEKINTNAKSFYKSFYSGLITGFHINIKNINCINPAIEFSFYPDYANIIDIHSEIENQKISKSLWIGTVIIGLGKKKPLKK